MSELPACRLCGADADADVRRPRHVAAVRELPARPTSSTAARRSTRCTCGSATTACWSSCRRTSRPRTSSATTRTSPRTPTSWVAHATRFVDDMPSRGSASAPTSFVVEVASNDGYLLQHVVAPRHPVPRHRAGREHRRGRRRARASRPTVDVPRRGRPARTVAAEHGHGRPGRRPTTCSRTCRTSSTSPRGLRALVADDGIVSHRVPAPAAADRGPAVRHDLPRALLLPLPAHRRSGAGDGRPHGRRRGGAADPRRVAAVLVDADRDARPSRSARVAQGAGRRGGRRPAHGRGPRGLRRGGRSRSRTDLRRVPDRRPRARARRWPAYGAPGQGQHAAQPLRRSARTCCRTRSTAARTSTGMFLPGHAHPDPRAGAARRDAARLHRDPAVEPAGGDRRPARVHPGVGRASSSSPSRGSRSI